MPQTQYTVLFVDDDAAMLRGLKRSLSEDEFTVLTAVSAAEAGAVLRRTPVDVVVCDQRMPGVTGIDFLTQIRRAYPEIKMLILSGHVSGLPIAVRAAEQIGVHEILSKPCSSQELSQAIHRALQPSTRFDERMPQTTAASDGRGQAPFSAEIPSSSEDVVSEKGA